jgi:3-oxoacyl-ACP reductase-like protein
MSIFAKIKNAIFGRAEAAEASAPAESTPAAQAETAAPAAAAPASPSPSTAPATAAPVDIAPILDAAVKKNGQKLDWKHSIVDLMKALDLDSSLDARKELATELNYTGDMGDSAKMNMWLHKALMKKLSENGGQVPADLLD